MAKQSLAIKYRPKTFDDVTEQASTKIILQQQLESGEVKHAYLFCGGAGTGKTTCARIFANEINKGEGNPIELDAASNNSIEDVRDISQQAKTKALDSEYKIFIIDECHALSNSAWQAMLKLIEEPPAKAIFIFCTTDPQKIPATIISRVQRYDFQRISQEGIVDRLWWILDAEGYNDGSEVIDKEPLEYIAKMADGGMRDAITLLDKALSFSAVLTLETVVKALGTVDYSVMLSLTNYVLNNEMEKAIKQIEEIYSSGKDIKQFVKLYVHFLLDVSKYLIGCEWKFINIPKLKEFETWIKSMDEYYSDILSLLDVMIGLDSNIKYSATPKQDIEAELILFMTGGEE